MLKPLLRLQHRIIQWPKSLEKALYPKVINSTTLYLDVLDENSDVVDERESCVGCGG